MIGIDISDRSIKVVQLANRGRRLMAHCAESLPAGVIENGLIQDKTFAQKILLKMLTSCGVGPRENDVVVASIPETQSFLRVVEVPQMDDDEVTEAIRWEIAQHIPFGIDNVYLDWQDLSLTRTQPGKAGAEKREVQVGATQRQVVDRLYEVLEVLQLDIGAFELESQAIVRAVISPELRERRGVLLVDVGGSATNVVIHDHGAMRFTATLHKGIDTFAGALPAAEGQVLQTQLGHLERDMESALSEKLLPSLDELAVEIRGIVEFYNSIDENHEVEEILMTGGGSNVPGLDRAFLKYFDSVHVQRGNPWVNVLPGDEVVRAPMDLKQSVRFATALGLALRPVLV